MSSTVFTRLILPNLLVKVVNPLTPERTLKELTEAHRRCEDIKQITAGYVKALQDSRASLANGKCFLPTSPIIGSSAIHKIMQIQIRED